MVQVWCQLPFNSLVKLPIINCRSPPNTNTTHIHTDIFFSHWYPISISVPITTPIWIWIRMWTWTWTWIGISFRFGCSRLLSCLTQIVQVQVQVQIQDQRPKRQTEQTKESNGLNSPNRRRTEGFLLILDSNLRCTL